MIRLKLSDKGKNRGQLVIHIDGTKRYLCSKSLIRVQVRLYSENIPSEQ